MHATPRPQPQLPWDDVHLFLVLSRSRTMGEAAETLSVDPSTVSRRLAGLEEALDTVLFHRGREGLRPTKAAEDLLPTAEIVEHGIAGFASAADGLEREVSGLVRMTCPSDVADVVVLPVLRNLLEAHPRLRVALEPGEATLDLSRREADLALRVRRPTRGDLVAKRVLTVTWKPAAAPDLAARLGPLGQAAEAPWIGWSEDQAGSPAARWLDSIAGVEPVLTSGGLATHVAAARAGIGVALLPAPSIEHFGLVPVEFTEDSPLPASGWPSHDLFLVTHHALVNVPRIRAIWDGLIGRLGAMSSE